MSSVIYQPKGRAFEYAPLAANLYDGCGHRCAYCYAPRARKMDWASFCDPMPRENILRRLQQDCDKIAGLDRDVLFCFSSDPYQPIEAAYKITREAIRVLGDYGLRPTILTKAGTWAIQRDKDLLCRADAIWAATLTLNDTDKSKSWEPGAAGPQDRIEALKIAKELGLSTWVSFEPVLDPDAVLRLLDMTYDVVDLYKVGKLNYHPLANEIDWKEFKDNIESRLQELGKPYYIKKDLAEAAEKEKIYDDILGGR